MADNIQDSILDAMDTLVNNRIDKIQADKTVIATIISCTNALTGEYKVSYNGGFLYAYASEGDTYTQNASVYVLVPQGDFTQKKTIVGKTQNRDNDENISFVSSAINDYNMIGKNAVEDPKGIQPGKLNSYKAESYCLFYQRGQSGNYLDINIAELENNLKEAEAALIEASFKTRLPKEHRISKTGEYGLEFILAFADRDNVDDKGNAAVKKLSYVIDSSNMTGNPFNFTSWFDQYNIYPIDLENFLYIDSILGYAKGFVEETDQQQAYLWGDDIFIKDIEFYGLKKITAVSGEYKLGLSMPQGSTFKSIREDDTLDIVAKVTQKQINNLSDATTFYWFIQDNRVTTDSDSYHMYGGVGWRRLKDKGNNYTCVVTGSENRAYENKYLCVAVYRETVILKEYFTIYNEASKRELSITSTLGVKFSFDRGIPELTCLVDGKESDFEAEKATPHKDSWFRFVWSKQDEFGSSTIFNQTKDELQKQYDQGMRDGIGYAALSSLKNQITLLEGVSWNKNKLTYPVKQVDSSATFKCSVYLRDRDPRGEETVEDVEYSIGVAEITLQNESIATPEDYYIIIENGDQVFQYSESGVSPDDERYADPLEIMPLTCHFYDPAGLEVNNNTYSVKWKVPLTDTMIVAPKEGMTINNASGLIEWCTSQIYPMAIAKNYNYQALTNQVTAIVEYQGQEYTKDTAFLFTKVGENGTNGTDLVGKISPTSKSNVLDSQVLTLQLQDNSPMSGSNYPWNTKQNMGSQVLDFNLYQRNEKLAVDVSNVYWSVSCGNSNSKSKYLSVDSGIVSWDKTDALAAMYRNQIIRARVRWEGNEYYAFYPLTVVNYNSNTSGGLVSYRVAVEDKRTLKSILYNADGRNPIYNKNQGIFISLGDVTGKYIEWTAEGGQPSKVTGGYQENPQRADFTLITEKDSSDGQTTVSGEMLTELYILPNDVCSGAYANNLVHGKIYANESSWQRNAIPEAEIYIPIYISLNTYGLASLNAWDGNHIEINEDDNYILAPQVGAGVKDNDNKFTGVVIGKAQQYDHLKSDGTIDTEQQSVGLLGYSHGKQSILLDAETGNATFGLPEQQASAGNQYTEGRIELVPGGESKIGMWRIGSRAIYNITKPNEEDSSNTFIGVEPAEPYGSSRSDYPTDSTYSQYPVKDSQIAIPFDAQGVILNSNPGYLSIKSKPLNADNSNIDWGGANTRLVENDSLEVELDPHKSSVFSIYRHTKKTDGSGKNYRYPLVGINANGQFYTNAIKDGESTMGIGAIGAFHDAAAQDKYVGAQFGWKDYNLFKFFVDTTETGVTDETRTLFISTGSKVDYTRNGQTTKGNEYPRAVGIYGKSVSLLAPDIGKTNEPDSTHKLTISQTTFKAGHEKSYLEIPAANNGDTKLELENNLIVNTATDRQTNVTTGDLTIEINGTSKSASGFNMSAKDSTIKLSGNLNYEIDKNFEIKNNVFRITGVQTAEKDAKDASSTLTLGTLSSIEKTRAYLKLSNADSVRNQLIADNGLDIITDNKGIKITSGGSAEGIVLQATSPNGTDTQGVTFSMIPQDGGGSDFFLRSPHGEIQSKNDVGRNQSGIQITSGFSTNWGIFVGTIGNTTNSIIATRDIQTSDGWIYGNDFSFNGDHSYQGYWGTRSSKKLSDHLANIYNLLQDLKRKIDSEATARANADNNLGTRISNEATARANADNSLRTAINGKANANHTHSDYVTSSRFAGHWHHTAGSYTPVKKPDDSQLDLNGVSTSGPLNH